MPHRRIGYVLTPHYVRWIALPESPRRRIALRTNGLGLRRDTEVSYTKPPGRVRIVVLGDSQSEGIVANGETYAARCEQLLGQKGVEVWNAAVSGYSPLLSYLWWREHQDIGADLVLLALYIGNDLGELFGRRQDFGGWGQAFWLPTMAPLGQGRYRIEPPGRACSPLAEHSHRLSSTFRAWELLARALPAQCGDTSDNQKLREVMASCPGCLQSLWQPWWLRQVEGGRDEAFRRLRWILLRLQEEVRARGATLWVLVLPTKLGVEEEQVRPAVAQAAAVLGLDPRELRREENRLRREVLRLLRQMRIVALDARPVLRAVHRRQGKQLYWQLDWHLNADGHAALAGAVAPRLQAWLGRRRTNL